MKGLAALYQKEGLLVRERVPLSRYTTLKVGGPARVMIFPRNYWELLRSLAMAEALGEPVFFLGGGSNLLVREGGLPGVVLNMRGLTNFCHLGGGLVEAEAGVPLARFLSLCQKEGLSGLEFLAGVPATVGGAVAMNAGAFGQEIKDVLKEIVALHQGHLRVYRVEDLPFGYRSWGGPEGALIVKCLFQLMPNPPERVQQNIADYLAKRRQTQPLNNFTAGCVFKNPPEAPAGFLIESVGLKGFTLGRAAFSRKHANFIVNHGGATADEILALIDWAKEKVFRAYGIELFEEVAIVGEA